MFDTERLYEFWGIEATKRLPYMEATMAGKIPEPNWAESVFLDVKPFLERAQERCLLVLLTRTADVDFQKRKLERSGLGNFFSGALYTTAMHAKGELVHDFLTKRGKDAVAVFYVDDEPMNIHDVKSENPQVFAMLMRRPDGLERVHDGYLPPDAIVEDFADVAHHMKLYV